MYRIYSKIFLVLLLSFQTVLTYTQNTFTIYDANTLESLPYATVQITSENNNRRFNTISDEFGNVEVPMDIDGKILLKISFIGYETLYKNTTVTQLNLVYLYPHEKIINDVVVTGNSKERTTKESIYTIEVISREDIESRSANTLADVLISNQKIELTQNALGTSINMQGLSGANVKIMIDGVPVIGRLNGEIDISKINLNNIERIEIIDGPLSVIYGSNALAGVINLISKKSQKKTFEASLKTFYQTIGNYNLDAQASYKNKNHYFSLSGGRYFFEGWDEEMSKRDLSWDPKETYFGDFTYVYRTKKDWFNRFKVSYFQDRILDRKNRTGPFTIADDNWFKTRKIDFTYILTGTYKKNFYVQSTNGYNNFQRVNNTYIKDLSTLETTLKENTSFNDYQDTSLFHQFVSRTSVSYNNKESKYNYQIGYDLNVESGNGKRLLIESNKPIVIADIVAFATFTYKPSKKISIQPAMRYGYNSKFSTTPTVSASIKYDFSKDFIWRLSYGMGFRAPSLKEMYLNFQDINHNIKGNENLKAEKSHNISTTLDYSKAFKTHNFQFKLNGFFNHKYDGIILSQVINQNKFVYTNAFQYQTLGFDFDIHYKFKNLKINTGFFYLGTYNKEKENNSNLKQFLFKPVFNFNASYHFKKIGLKINVFNKFTGSYFDYFLDSNSKFISTKLESYNLMDITLEEHLWEKRIYISLGLRNIFDVKSINNNIASGGVHSGDSGTQISTGRSFFIGLKLNFVK